MDFYSHQDQARSKSFWLLVLFAVGLLLLSTVTTLLLGLALRQGAEHPDPQLPLFSLTLYGWVSGGVFLAALLAAAFKYLGLHSGGRKVAESLGGRRVLGSTTNHQERQLLNVVEEMAIAAGVPVPPVYILGENGINAFAAGFSINDAVIGVTQGAVDHFSRDELQAVIGHEFSHIFNGDMRLNLRLVALLYGLFFVGNLGRLLLHVSDSGSSSNKKNNGGVLLALGIGLLIMGYLGGLWARIMQSAINRQREYLADASAVQFTRNPQGLASALKKVGGHQYGSVVSHSATAEFSHLFFGPAMTSQFAGLFASHPPLRTRILRLDPSWDGHYSRSTPNQGQEVSSKVQSSATAALAGSAQAALAMAAALPAALNVASREPLDACYLIFALLLDEDDNLRQQQLQGLKAPQRALAYFEELGSLQPGQRLPLVEKAIPSLKALSESQYKAFTDTLMGLVQADGKVSLFEWLLYRLVSHQLGAQYSTRVEAKVRPHKLASLSNEVAELLSAVAWLSPHEEKAKRAFGMGANSMGLYGISLLPTPAPSSLGPALTRLQQAREPVRQRFLQGVLKAMKQDGEITAEEGEFFRVLAVCLDCPVALP